MLRGRRGARYSLTERVPDKRYVVPSKGFVDFGKLSQGGEPGAEDAHLVGITDYEGRRGNVGVVYDNSRIRRVVYEGCISGIADVIKLLLHNG